MHIFDELAVFFVERTVVVVFQIHFETLQVIVYLACPLFGYTDVDEYLVNEILDARCGSEVHLP